ncbi:Long chain acyl-CoA synthetase 7 peroxisomal [Quaeritorhiza haematococci]|nr:Long chain acyl-CoA synthetase 7 peroxisomal [Quaeritorhiza haematococci]
MKVCGLKWSPEEGQLASGGNDNKLLVWDKMNEVPTLKFTEHQAAVKAISWSPHQHGLLASGGGTADRRIRFWNTLTGTAISSHDTGSQVCNLSWSKTANEFVSTHGYSQNQVIIWKYPSMQQIATLTGHTYRVLYLAMSPDGQNIVTGAGDETLRFWNRTFKKSVYENLPKATHIPNMVSDLPAYTVEVADAPAVEGEGKPRRHVLFPKGGIVAPEHVTTLYENFMHGVKQGGDKEFLGHRPITNGQAGAYVWQSYNEVHTRAKNVGAALVKRGLTPDTNIGLFSINRPEWVITEQGCFMYSFCTVPLYDTLGNEAIEYIVTQTEMPAVFATKDKVKILLGIADKLPNLKHIIVMDTPDDDVINRGKEANKEVISMADFEKEGAASPADPVPPKPETLATICYTSGTTGLPKGVMLSHKAILSFCASAHALIKAKRMYPFGPTDVHISYLPLAHVFERVVQVVIIYVAAKIGFYQGDTLKLLDDVAVLKPTVFASVPRLYNRIYDKVNQGIKAKGGLAATLFKMGFEAKKNGLKNGTVTHWLWDRLVFSKVRERLGGRVKVMLTGAAPISAEVMDFLRICFSAEMIEGYGQTETSAALSCTDRADLTSGHVGAPLPTSEIKLVDVPGMNYTSQDKPYPRGEICVRGPHCFTGYYKLAEKTAEAIDKDGWVHTGDIGLWDEKGRLKIIDRVKNIFKLAQGEYIAPEKIENVYARHELIAQAFVYGDSLQATLVGVLVPDADTFVPWCKSKGWDKPIADLVKDEAVRKAVLQALDAHAKSSELKGFECLKNIRLDATLFSMDNNLLTPTFKLKRFEAKNYYKKEIEEMYAEIAPPS